MTLTFTTAAKRVAQKPIEFTLDEKVYTFEPPKTTAIFLSRGGSDSVRAQLDWLDAGLPDEQAAQIRDRLLDLEDDLDVPQVLDIVGALLTEAAGRPTTPSPE